MSRSVIKIGRKKNSFGIIQPTSGSNKNKKHRSEKNKVQRSNKRDEFYTDLCRCAKQLPNDTGRKKLISQLKSRHGSIAISEESMYRVFQSYKEASERSSQKKLKRRLQEGLSNSLKRFKTDARVIAHIEKIELGNKRKSSSGTGKKNKSQRINRKTVKKEKNHPKLTVPLVVGHADQVLKKRKPSNGQSKRRETTTQSNPFIMNPDGTIRRLENLGPAEKSHYDYWANENNMYDNYDYRPYQNEYDQYS